MKRFIPTDSQRGDFLVEAVISLAIVSIMVQGMLFITSRTSAVQSDLRLQEIAVQQMRAALIQNMSGSIDICNSTPVVQLPNDVNIATEVQGCDAPTTALIDGITVSGVPKPIVLSLTSDLLGGQLVVGGTWLGT